MRVHVRKKTTKKRDSLEFLLLKRVSYLVFYSKIKCIVLFFQIIEYCIAFILCCFV